jgi:ubiquinone/menaquinone biosynthesis C-methylase UbiE
MDDVLMVLRAAGEATRLRILSLCAVGDLTAGELTRVLGQSQPGVSRHLKLLCDAGLLERYQEGAWAFFHLPAAGRAGELGRLIISELDMDDPFFVRDRQRLRAINAERKERAETYFRENAASWDRIRALHVDETIVEDAILAMVPEEPLDVLLDIGTGTGRMLQLLAGHAHECIGIDQSRDMLAVARENLSGEPYRNCTVRQADMYQLPDNDRSVDLAILHMVLHFADDPAAVFGEAARVLRPGGTFLLVDFAPHEMEELRAQFAHRRLGFRDREIEAWAQAEGFDVANTRALPGDPLTVTIWSLKKSADVPATAPTREVRAHG